MSDEILEKLACPNCLHPIDIRQHGRHIQCPACDSNFLLQGHLCPYCQTYHKEEESFCSQCGESLTRTCRKCMHKNWSGDEYCVQCGAAMDIFELLHQTRTQSMADRLAEQREMARAQKAAAKKASAARMAAMMAEEEARQATIRKRMAARKQQDKQMLIGAFTLVGILLLLGIIAIFFF